MNEQDTDEIEVADIFKALGHPARLAILKSLQSDERCVCDLVEVAGMGWSTVSRHLSVLKEAGIVEDEKRGLQVFYRMKLPCVSDFIECLERKKHPLPMSEVGHCCF